MSKSSRKIDWVFLFLVVILIIAAAALIKTPKYSWKPITYRLGKVDERFSLSREEFGRAVKMAAAIWGKPFHRDFFREDKNGEIEVNIIYDYRQESTDKLKNLNYKIDRSRNSYEELKSRLASMRAEYESKKIMIDNDIAEYNIRANALNKEIELWNGRGGASQSIYARLMKEKDELTALRENLNSRQEEMKMLTDTINNLVLVINEIASNNNLDLLNQQNIGNALGHEFCEGFYENKNGKRSITIYQYDNEYRLVRVLAHEFGHALGLSHSKNKESLMYPVIQSDSLEIARDDIEALKKLHKFH
ncbi:MAG: hypothetical protein APR62_02465 [Smithella sp. SDB]|nr:MAG: hypothetical protein APR62_02465 [Smithella sp. SDB]